MYIQEKQEFLKSKILYCKKNPNKLYILCILKKIFENWLEMVTNEL